MDSQDNSTNNLRPFNNHFKNSDNSTIKITGGGLPKLQAYHILRIKCRIACIQHLKLSSLSATTDKCWMPPRALGFWGSEKVVLFPCEYHQLPRCDLGHDLRIARPLQMAPAIRLHRGNLFWFLALISEPFVASLTGVSTQQGGNPGTLDSVFRVAKGGYGGFTWQCGSGTQGWESLPWHNGPHHWGSGWVSCHNNRHKNYPPDFPSGFSGYSTVKCGKPPFQSASRKGMWVFSTYYS